VRPSPERECLVKSGPISPKGEVASCGKGVGGGGSTQEVRTTSPHGGKHPLLCSSKWRNRWSDHRPHLKRVWARTFVEEVRKQLIEDTYHPLPARRKDIPKLDGKLRPLGIPAICDHVVQMATKMVIEPIFETDFKECSYGFRPKRDAKGAIRHIRRAVRKGVYWVVDVDIVGYFDNIPHEKLMKLVEQRISDRRILILIRKWLKAGFVKDDQLCETDLGSPLGGVISPLIANIYLNYLDTIWEKKFTELGTLVRYADDLVILCKTKDQALKSIDVLKSVFRKLELQMNTSKSKLINLWDDKEGFDFLGMHHRKIPKQVKGVD
jgi:RNA-directed DNA polymerase